MVYELQTKSNLDLPARSTNDVGGHRNVAEVTLTFRVDRAQWGNVPCSPLDVLQHVVMLLKWFKFLRLFWTS